MTLKTIYLLPLLALFVTSCLGSSETQCEGCDYEGSWTLYSQPTITAPSYANQLDFPEWYEWMPDSKSLNFWSFWYRQSSDDTLAECQANVPSYIHLLKYERSVTANTFTDRIFLDVSYPMTAEIWADWCYNSWVFSPVGPFKGNLSSQWAFRYPTSPISNNEFYRFVNSRYSVSTSYKALHDGCEVNLKEYQSDYYCDFLKDRINDKVYGAWPTQYFCGQIYPSSIDLSFNCDDTVDYCASQWNNDIFDGFSPDRKRDTKEGLDLNSNELLFKLNEVRLTSKNLPTIGYRTTVQEAVDRESNRRRENGADLDEDWSATFRTFLDVNQVEEVGLEDVADAEEEEVSEEASVNLDARTIQLAAWPRLPLLTTATLDPNVRCFKRQSSTWRNKLYVA